MSSLSQEIIAALEAQQRAALQSVTPESVRDRIQALATVDANRDGRVSAREAEEHLRLLVNNPQFTESARALAELACGQNTQAHMQDIMAAEVDKFSLTIPRTIQYYRALGETGGHITPEIADRVAQTIASTDLANAASMLSPEQAREFQKIASQHLSERIAHTAQIMRQHPDIAQAAASLVPVSEVETPSLSNACRSMGHFGRSL
ncbi:MAG: hypothetical protein K2Q12_02390 [Rickettsiales bacterium]|nr:hypothetical protein [Rickettsiales bacterium]